MVQDECVCPDTMNMESMLLLGAGLMTAAFVAVVVFAPGTLTDEPADWEIVDVCLGSEHSSNPIVAHYHATLRIFIDGSEVSIASNIGIDDSECDGMRGIHTHDETGKLHIETPTQMNAPRWGLLRDMGRNLQRESDTLQGGRRGQRSSDVCEWRVER